MPGPLYRPRPGGSGKPRPSIRASVTTPLVGGLPPVATPIPYSWLRIGVSWWAERPRNSTSITLTNGPTTQDSDSASIAEYGNQVYAATVDSAVDGAPGVLSGWVLQYFAVGPGQIPRPKFVQVPLVPLNGRTLAEIRVILSVNIGTRIHITDPPPSWPPGLSEQVVEGVSHSIGAEERSVTWRTSPVVGQVNGQSGPWFHIGSSMINGPDKLLF